MKRLKRLIALVCVLATPVAYAAEKPATSSPADVKNSTTKADADLDIRMTPAFWHHGLNSTSLTGYRRGEHLIISQIWTGALGSDAVVKHSLQVKVSAWDKPFTTNWESDDKRQKETLTVTLRENKNAREMAAEFDHAVYEDGRVFLRFSGITILARLN